MLKVSSVCNWLFCLTFFGVSGNIFGYLSSFVSLFQTTTKDLSQLKASEIVNELNLAITQRDVDSLEYFLNLSTHKSVSVRRKLADLVAELGDESRLEFLKGWQDSESDRPTWIKIETAIDRINRKDGEQDYSKDVFSVGEALGLVKGLVSSREYVVKGEISESNAVNQMYFFKMKDSEGVVMDCWCFAGIVMRAGFALNEGIEVKATGKFKISNKSSRLYFDVNKIELTGEGEYIRNLKILEEKLRDEGLMDESRKRKPMILPRRVLLIASPNSAAITDFYKVVNHRRGGLEIFHLPIKTQGRSAENEILNALRSTNSLVEEYNIDTIVMTRGGGSKEDLIVFNSEKVVRALHGLARPTIVAIGHERDTTLAELVADVRAATPSQAAELVSQSNIQTIQMIDKVLVNSRSIMLARSQSYLRFCEQITSRLSVILRQELQNKSRSVHLIDQYLRGVFYQIRKGVNYNLERIKMSVLQLIVLEKNKLSGLDLVVLEEKRRVERQMYSLNRNIEIINQRVMEVLKSTQEKLRITILSVENLNPKEVLKKGYGIVKQDGKWIGRINDLSKGKKVELEMFDGVIGLEPNK